MYVRIFLLPTPISWFQVQDLHHHPAIMVTPINPLEKWKRPKLWRPWPLKRPRSLLGKRANREICEPCFVHYILWSGLVLDGTNVVCINLLLSMMSGKCTRKLFWQSIQTDKWVLPMKNCPSWYKLNWMTLGLNLTKMKNHKMIYFFVVLWWWLLFATKKKLWNA